MSLEKVPVVWVTGASRGIGAAVARAFGEIGATVVLSGRNARALRRNTREMERLGQKATFVECDVTSELSVRRARDSISKRFGAVDVIVNNAGVTYFKS